MKGNLDFLIMLRNTTLKIKKIIKSWKKTVYRTQKDKDLFLFIEKRKTKISSHYRKLNNKVRLKIKQAKEENKE